MGGGLLRRRPAAALLCALLVGVALSIPTPAHASAEAESRLLSLHNQARAAEGLGSLRPHGDLVEVARRWAARMRDDHEAGADRGDALRHNPDLAAQLPSSYRRAGENVGYTVLTGAAPNALAERLHAAYMDSDGHRRNILGDFDRAGVGVVTASDGTMWSTVVFMREKATVTTAGAEREPAPTPSAAPDPDPPADPDPQEDHGPPEDPEPAEAPEPVTARSLFGPDWPQGYLAPGPFDVAALLRGRGDARLASLLGGQRAGAAEPVAWRR